MVLVVLEIELADELVVVRPFAVADRGALLRGRDEEFHAFLGKGSSEPTPAACIWVEGRIVGWIDYDRERPWLDDDEVNVGYNVFADDRGNGYATRALRLLDEFLQTQVPAIRPTLLIDPANAPSLAVADRAGFRHASTLDGQLLFKSGRRQP